MRIINLMLGERLGGIERASVDYADGLQQANIDVLMITSPKADINAVMMVGNELCSDYALTHLQQFGAWDFMAARRLAYIIEKYEADLIITHGNRALQLARRAGVAKAPIIAVSHNYNIQHLQLADYVFCITEHMLQHVRVSYPKFNAQNSFHIPNMLPYSLKYRASHWHNPLRIGAMGRMVEKKGFAVWLKAIARLREKIGENIPFEAHLAGDGYERIKLEKLSRELGIENIVKFRGWIEKSQDFYNDIDIFCLPSLDEPFGIVLLEAMNAGLPIISTKTIGAQEILQENTGIIVGIGDSTAMCEQICELVANRQTAQEMGKNAYDYVQANYSKQVISQKIIAALNSIN